MKRAEREGTAIYMGCLDFHGRVVHMHDVTHNRPASSWAEVPRPVSGEPRHDICRIFTVV